MMLFHIRIHSHDDNIDSPKKEMRRMVSLCNQDKTLHTSHFIYKTTGNGQYLFAHND